MSEDFSIKTIYRNASYQAQREGKPKDSFANSEVLKYLLNCFPDTKELFNTIFAKSQDFGKPLNLKTSDRGKGSTDDSHMHSIVIEINENLLKDQAKAVFIHELGESDYIIRSHPYVEDSKENRENFKYVMELFSHTHVYRLAKHYRLIKYLKKDDKAELNSFINVDYIKKYPDKWLLILKLTWAIISNSHIRFKKFFLKGYLGNAKIINRIVRIVRKTNTMGSPEQVKHSMDEVLIILKQIGMPQDVESKKR